MAKSSFPTNDQDLTKEIVKGGGIAFTGNLIGNVLTFGLHILLGRSLGPGDYGLYSLGTSVIGIAQSVALLGLQKGVIRFCALYRGKGNNAQVKGTIFSALLISLLSSVSVAGLLFILSRVIAESFFREPALLGIIRVFALALPFYVLVGISASFAQAFRQIKYQQGVQNIFRPLVNLVLVGLLLVMGFQLVGAVYAFLISGLTSAALGLYFLWKIFPEVLSIAGFYNVKKLLRFSLPTFFIEISYLLLNYTDRIMLGYFSKASDVGIYNAASVVALRMTIFLAAFMAIFSPMVSDLYSQKRYGELHQLFRLTTRWVLTLSLPLFLILAIYADVIMSIFGSSFAKAGLILLILALAQLVNVSTGPVGMLLQMTGRQDIDFLNGITLVALNIGLNLWLIPIYGTLGAALATSSSLVLIHTARLIEVFKMLKMLPYDLNYIKSITAGIIAAMIAITTRMIFSPIWLSALAGTVLLTLGYIVVLWAIGLDQEDRMAISMVKRKTLVVLGVNLQ